MFHFVMAPVHFHCQIMHNRKTVSSIKNWYVWKYKEPLGRFLAALCPEASLFYWQWPWQPSVARYIKENAEHSRTVCHPRCAAASADRSHNTRGTWDGNGAAEKEPFPVWKILFGQIYMTTDAWIEWHQVIKCSCTPKQKGCNVDCLNITVGSTAFNVFNDNKAVIASTFRPEWNG